MSHITEVDCEIRSLEALKRAAKKLGLTFYENQKTYRWYGRSVGNYPLPQGFTTNDLGKCDHAIGIDGDDQAYQIGIVGRRDGKDGYILHFDFWNRGYGIQDLVGDNASKLVDWYAAEVAKEEAESLGYSMVSEKVLEDGTIELLYQA